MFESIRKEIKGNWEFIIAFTSVLIIVIGFSLWLGFKSTEVQPIRTTNMDNGVICYTFNTSIDCLQVER